VSENEWVEVRGGCMEGHAVNCSPTPAVTHTTLTPAGRPSRRQQARRQQALWTLTRALATCLWAILLPCG
jgi:hypothetical protein